ncbi:MAG: right-handed parallel beta-helix repeat-containing protein [Candidatus Brocadiia bacterium]
MPTRTRGSPVATVLTLAALLPMAALAATFHVTPDGRDRHPGTADRPFATLARARDAVRRLVDAGLEQDVTVVVHAGTYELAEPLTFGPQDSGTERHAITYAAAPGDRPLVSGGRAIAGWEADGKLWRTTVPGVKEGRWHFRQLWVNGRRAVRARSPNAEAQPPCFQLLGATLSDDLDTHTYRFPPKRLQQWTNLGGVEAVVFGNWATTRKRFQHADPASGVAQMAGPHARPHRAMAPRQGRWCYLENAAEFLDQPGEWYLDRASGVLSYWPRPGEAMAEARVVAPRLTRLLLVQGTAEQPVHNLHFLGIRFAHTGWSPPPGGYLGIQACHFTRGTGWNKAAWARIPAAIRFDYASHCSLREGAVTRLGGCGIELVDHCRDLVVEGNHVADASANGILLGGPKDEASVPKDCRIANNWVHACGLDYHGAVGIWVGFAQGAVVAHNRVHHLPYSGISLGWQWNPRPTPCKENTVAFNHIFDVMRRLGDGGGIYTLGFQPGTVIRGNHIHHVRRSALAQAAPNNGMFIDQGSKGFLFERNLIYHTAHQPVRFNQCRREWHTWRHNHFAQGPRPGDAPPNIVETAGLEAPHQGRLLGED